MKSSTSQTRAWLKDHTIQPPEMDKLRPMEITKQVHELERYKSDFIRLAGAPRSGGWDTPTEECHNNLHIVTNRNNTYNRNKHTT